MLNVTNLVGFGAGNLALPSVQYVTSVGSGNNATTYTFTAVSLGTASGRSLVVFGVNARSGTGNITISGVTVGGVSATSITQSPADNATAAIYSIVTSSTNADIVVTTSAAAADCGVGVWAVYDLSSTTVYSSNSASAASGATLSSNINTPSNGVVIAAGCIYTGSTRTFTWVGVTERYDESFAGGTNSQTGGDYTTSAAETPRLINLTPSGSVNNLALASASWQ